MNYYEKWEDIHDWTWMKRNAYKCATHGNNKTVIYLSI